VPGKRPGQTFKEIRMSYYGNTIDLGGRYGYVRRPYRNANHPNAAWKNHPMTDTQAAKILKELDRRVLDPTVRAELIAAVNAGMTRDGNPATKGSASALIDWLLAKPFTPRGGTTTPAQRADSVTVTEEGFYLYQNEAYRVQRTKDGQRLYAKKATGSGWDYEAGKGVVFSLTPGMLMTAAEIAKFGVDHQFCINCSHGLTDLVSQHVGLGTQCGPEILGKDGYRAARQHAIDSYPEVAEYVEMQKAGSKARREAKKAQLARINQAQLDQDHYWDAQIQQREIEEDRRVAEAKMARDGWLGW
jgi:hypothetical protein